MSEQARGEAESGTAKQQVRVCEWPGCGRPVVWAGRGRPPRWCLEFVDGVRHTAVNAHRARGGAPATAPAGWVEAERSRSVRSPRIRRTRFRREMHLPRACVQGAMVRLLATYDLLDDAAPPRRCYSKNRKDDRSGHRTQDRCQHRALLSRGQVHEPTVRCRAVAVAGQRSPRPRLPASAFG